MLLLVIGAWLCLSGVVFYLIPTEYAMARALVNLKRRFGKRYFVVAILGLVLAYSLWPLTIYLYIRRREWREFES